MSVIPIDLKRQPARRATRPRRLLRRLVQGLDALATYAVKHAVSEQDLRRTDADIRRCRELIARKDIARDVHPARVRVRAIRVKVQ